MAIYRFDVLGGREVVAEMLFLCKSEDVQTANGYVVSKETYDRLLAELEANESAAGADDGWKPASEPPDSNRDVIVRLCGYARGFLGFFDTNSKWYRYTLNGLEEVEETEDEVTHWHELPKPPSSPPQPEPPKEPEPVWQGPGWYEIEKRGCECVVSFSRDGSTIPYRSINGNWSAESDLIRLIRLATDDELRHVCTHGTEPDSRPEVG